MKAMKKQIYLLLFLALGLTTIQAQNGEKNFIDKPYIEVTGKAEMEVIPDQIYLNIVINEKDNQGKMVLAQSEKSMIERLKALGIDTNKDLSVKDMSSNFKNYWLKNSEIMASKEYELLVTSAQTAGRVLQEMEKIGISNVSVSRVDHSQIEQYRRTVKVNAVKVASEKATDMAEAISQKTGKAIYIQEIENNFYAQRNLASNMMMKVRGTEMADAESVPDIEFEKIRLEYQVIVKFELF